MAALARSRIEKTFVFAGTGRVMGGPRAGGGGRMAVEKSTSRSMTVSVLVQSAVNHKSKEGHILYISEVAWRKFDLSPAVDTRSEI